MYFVCTTIDTSSPWRQRINAKGQIEQEMAHLRCPPNVFWSWFENIGALENGLHYRRDRTLQEHHSQLRMGHAPLELALLNNTALGLMARQGETNLAHAQRTFSYQFYKAVSTIAA